MISFVFFSHKLLMHFTVKILRNTLRLQDMSLKVLEPMNLNVDIHVFLRSACFERLSIQKKRPPIFS